MLQNIFLISILVAIGILGILRVIWFSKGKQVVKQWTEQNGFSIISMRYQWLRSGPFFFIERNQDLYRITVRDNTGEIRKGWIRTGKWFSYRPEVKWDSEIGSLRMSVAIPITCIIGGILLLAAALAFLGESESGLSGLLLFLLVGGGVFVAIGLALWLLRGKGHLP